MMVEFSSIRNEIRSFSGIRARTECDMDIIDTPAHTHSFSVTRSFQRQGEPKRYVRECEVCGTSVMTETPVEETEAA